jgi:hypothetical protein
LLHQGWRGRSRPLRPRLRLLHQGPPAWAARSRSRPPARSRSSGESRSSRSTTVSRTSRWAAPDAGPRLPSPGEGAAPPRPPPPSPPRRAVRGRRRPLPLITPVHSGDSAAIRCPSHFKSNQDPSTCRPVRRPPPGGRPPPASRPSPPLMDLIHRARPCLQDGRLRSTTTATTSCTVWPSPPTGGPSAASPASCRGRSARQPEPGSAPPSR